MMIMANDVQNLVMPTAIVLNELDEFARQWDLLRRGADGWECRRARPRRQFRTSCEIWFFENGGRTVHRQIATTRNLSEQGIGLLTKCVVLQGAPIEIEIHPHQRPPTHLAGVVAFCRYTQRSFHEVGVALKACQREPIFAADAVKAVASTDWLQQALKDLKIASGLHEALLLTGG